ncbi:MAG: xanthine dehydrogenase family protein molybdopterin-binding subunit [Rhodospirillaceae bacterium]
MSYKKIGLPVLRTEDERRLLGNGRYTDDLAQGNMARAFMVRSPHAHAEIVSVDIAHALTLSGVLGIYTIDDWLHDGLGHIPHSPIPSGGDGLGMSEAQWRKIFLGRQYPLAQGTVRYVGEVVAMVVAETEAFARLAAEAIQISYQELNAVALTKLASLPDAPRVWTETNNICLDTEFGDGDATDSAFECAEHSVKHRFEIPRVTGVPMEPRAAIGEFDPSSGLLTLTAGGGGAVRFKRELIQIFDVDDTLIRVITPDVGGNFGTRNRLYPEFPLVMWASKRLGKKVRWLSDRSENFLSDFQGRDLISSLELALDKKGKFLALRVDNVSNIGAFSSSFTPLSKGAEISVGPYHFDSARVRARGVFSHSSPTNPYRSAGRPEVIYALERLIDIAADQIGIDRVEIRRRNLIPDSHFPYDNKLGMTYDSGEMIFCLNKALELSDWVSFEKRKKESKERGFLRGRGLACYVESSSGAPLERTEITINPEKNNVEVIIGTQDSGQGHATSFCQVAAEFLGIPLEKIVLLQGDTDFVSVGGGSHSGRSMRMAGTVIFMASEKLISKGRALAALLLEAAIEDISFEEGVFSIGGTDRSIGWFELAKQTENLKNLPVELEGGLTESAENLMKTPAFPSGTHICEVEVDPETGVSRLCSYVAVDDVGRVINPIIVEGQIHGGIVQALGQAMMEEFVFHPETAQPLSATFMDYCLPRADDVPFFISETHEVLTNMNPLGIKSGGEAGTTPALGCYMNAILDALTPFEVRDLRMPATPQRVWQAIRGHN